MTSVKQRMLQYSEKQGDKVSKMPEKIGMGYSSFTGSSLKRPINSDAIANYLAIYPEVNLYWLLTGQEKTTDTNFEVAKESDVIYKSKSNKGNCKDTIIEDLRFTIKTMNIAMEQMQARIKSFEKK